MTVSSATTSRPPPPPVRPAQDNASVARARQARDSSQEQKSVAEVRKDNSAARSDRAERFAKDDQAARAASQEAGRTREALQQQAQARSRANVGGSLNVRA
ncbi:MAG: hypothetical protein IPL39_20950 [Opitutaceae bacterium]|nr:hypothetical protein [Opitutaceae bacterium]